MSMTWPLPMSQITSPSTLPLGHCASFRLAFYQFPKFSAIFPTFGSLLCWRLCLQHSPSPLPAIPAPRPMVQSLLQEHQDEKDRFPLDWLEKTGALLVHTDTFRLHVVQPDFKVTQIRRRKPKSLPSPQCRALK